MAPENEVPQQDQSSDLDLLGFDPESDGTALEAEIDRVEALEDADDTEDAQAQDVETEQDEGEKDEAEKMVGNVEADAGKFYFNGKAYESQEKAVHARKSYIGQIRKLQNDKKVAEQEAETLRQKIAKLDNLSQTPEKVTQSPTKPASEVSKEQGEVKGLDEFVDWTVFNELYDDPKYGPAVANRYLAKKNQEYLDQFKQSLSSEFDEKLKNALNPFQASTEQMQFFEKTVEDFTEVGTRVDNDGNLLFPELNPDVGDEEFIERVALRVKQEPAFQELGHFGVYCAYLVEKDWERFHVPEVRGAETATQTLKPTQEKPRDPKTGQFVSPSDALIEFNRRREAAKAGAVIDDPNGTPRVKPGSGRSLKGWAAGALASLEKAATDQEDKHLMGF